VKITRKVTLANENGLSIIACIKLSELAKKFDSDLFIQVKSSSANVKHLASLVFLTVIKGPELTITAEGDDAEKAIEAIANFFRERYREAQDI
jgi:phosphotransferase system HPr (HPr) family protein